LVVVGGTRREEGPDRSRLGESLRVVAASPMARLAIGAMAVSQAAMVAVMTMTPVHMKIHGHEELSFYVISAHIAGMFAFSPLVGRFSDRRGPFTAVVTGSMILSASTIAAAIGSGAEWLLFPSLWGLGLGWNFCLIGGSALLVGSVAQSERVGVQGSADLMMSLCGAVAGFSSGFIRSALGYHVLALLAAGAAAVLLIAAGYARNRGPEVALGLDGQGT
jgi:MFS family permease